MSLGFEEPYGFTIDASPIAGDREQTASGFLRLARSSGVKGFELVCSDTVGLRLPSWETDPELTEFVLVTGDHETAWQLRSRSRTWVDDASSKLPHEWSYRFETVEFPRAPQLDAPEATDELRRFLAPHADDPWFDGAVGRALTILDGGELPEPASVVPWGVDEVRERLYYAASIIPGGKLTGMGGFDDFVTVDHQQLIYTFTHAFAASTRPST